jgi:hypothetical protein
MPHGIPEVGKVPTVAKNEPKDPEFESFLRAAARERMERLGWGTTDLSHATGFDQGYLHKWFTGERATTSAVLVKRLIDVFSLDPLELFKGLNPPPERYFGTHVPKQHRDRAEPSHSRTAPTKTAPPAGPGQTEAAKTAPKIHGRRG